MPYLEGMSLGWHSQIRTKPLYTATAKAVHHAAATIAMAAAGCFHE
jgi:hypothetical protein